MVWNNLIVVYYALHNVVKSYVKVVNSIINFFEPTIPTNNITNETIPIYYIIKQGLKLFFEKYEASVQK